MGTFPSVFIGQSTGQGADSESNNGINLRENSEKLTDQITPNHSGHILAGGGLILKTEARLDKKKPTEIANNSRQASFDNDTTNYEKHITVNSQLSLSHENFIESTKSVPIDTPKEQHKNANKIEIFKDSSKRSPFQNQPNRSDSKEIHINTSHSFKHQASALKPPLFGFLKRPNHHYISRNQSPNSQENPAIGYSFSPAGLLIPYHFGVTSYLLETGVLNEHSPIAGASSGSLACIANISKLNLIECLGLVNSICVKAKEKGTAGRLQEFLNSVLEEILPDNIHECVNKRPGSVTIAVTEVFPFKGKFINHFFSREDVIECLMASCNIPFYFSNWPLVRFRGKQCVDGFFAVPRAEIGCPPTDSLRKIKTRQINSEITTNDWITPDLSRRDGEILDYLKTIHSIQNRSWFETSSGFHISSMNNDSMGELFQFDQDSQSMLLTPDNPPNSVLAILGIFPPKAFSYQFMAATQLIKNRWQWNQVLRIALEGAEEPIVQELYDMGRIDCFRWLICEYIQLDKLLMENWGIIWGFLVNQIENYKSLYDSNYNSLFDYESTSPKSDKSINKEQMKILAINIVEKLIEARLIGPQFEHILSHDHRCTIFSTK